jgi:antitoxin (DNA-binding transcriptional repressor) of toxin-antitoxin stability system
MENLIALKDLRLNMEKYATEVKAGKSFIVLKQSKPFFKISPVEDSGEWEEVVDFTQIKKGGVNIDELLSRLAGAKTKRARL